MGKKKPNSLTNNKLGLFLVSQSGFEPETASLEGRCSIQLSYWPIFEFKKIKKGMIAHPQKKNVGVAGFEPATSSSQTRRDDRATLHPERKLNSKISIRFENRSPQMRVQK